MLEQPSQSPGDRVEKLEKEMSHLYLLDCELDDMSDEDQCCGKLARDHVQSS